MNATLAKLLRPFIGGIRTRGDWLQIESVLKQQPKNPGELSLQQNARLSDLLKHAHSSIPWWKAKIGDVLTNHPESGELNIAGCRNLLSRLPALTRSDVNHNLEALADPVSYARGERLLLSGASDEELWYIRDPEWYPWNKALTLRNRHAITGKTDCPRLVLKIVDPPESSLSPFQKLRSNIAQSAEREFHFDPRPFDGEQVEQVVRIISKNRNIVLAAYPSWILKFIEGLRLIKARAPFDNLRAVVCFGEVLHRTIRKKIENALAVKVYEEYEMREIGSIAHDDADHILRCNAEHAIVEILKGGVPAPEGELGEVVVTSLVAREMPFIRYATGDIARQPLASGLAFEVGQRPRFPQIEGRGTELLRSVNGDLLPGRPLVDAIVEQYGVTWFRIQQLRPRQFEIQLLDLFSKFQNPIEGLLKNYVGSQIELTSRLVGRLKSTTDGKHRYISSPPAASMISHDKLIDDELSSAILKTIVGTTKTHRF